MGSPECERPGTLAVLAFDDATCLCERLNMWASWDVMLGGEYTPYDDDNSAYIEQCYQRGMLEACVNIRSVTYIITLTPPQKQQQLNDRTRQRAVRRRSVGSVAEAPMASEPLNESEPMGPQAIWQLRHSSGAVITLDMEPAEDGCSLGRSICDHLDPSTRLNVSRRQAILRPSSNSDQLVCESTGMNPMGIKRATSGSLWTCLERGDKATICAGDSLTLHYNSCTISSATYVLHRGTLFSTAAEVATRGDTHAQAAADNTQAPVVNAPWKCIFEPGYQGSPDVASSSAVSPLSPHLEKIFREVWPECEDESGEDEACATTSRIANSAASNSAASPSYGESSKHGWVGDDDADVAPMCLSEKQKGKRVAASVEVEQSSPTATVARGKRQCGMTRQDLDAFFASCRYSAPTSRLAAVSISNATTRGAQVTTSPTVAGVRSQGNKERQEWIYPGFKVQRAESLHINGTKYVDPKDLPHERPRRLRESNFKMLINPNKVVPADLKAVADAAWEGGLRSVEDGLKDGRCIKFGPDDPAHFGSDLAADVIRSVQLHAVTEVGEKQGRLHAHPIIHIEHYSQLQLSTPRIQEAFKQGYNASLATAKAEAKNVLRAARIRHILEIEAGRRPFVQVSLINVKNYNDTMCAMLSRTALTSAPTSPCESTY